MPSLKKIKDAMIKLNISPDIIEKIDFDADTSGNNPFPVLAVIDKIDELLNKEQRFAVMEKQGCCKGGKRDKDCKEFAKKHVNKSIIEKLSLISEIEYMMVPCVNEDGTFTITMSNYQNGVHTGKTTCSCGTIKKLRQPFSVSSTYCGCCAGHFLYHYQNALGVKLRLKEINSSPLNTNGEEPCSFTFEII